MSVNRIWKKMTGYLFDWIFPKRCVFCDGLLGRRERYLCSKCRSRMPAPIREPRCQRCGKPLSSNEQEYCYDLSLIHISEPTRPY